MTTLTTIIQDALDQGINIELILRQTGIAHQDFIDRLDGLGFDQDEAKLIRQIIRNWREGNDD